MDLSFNIRSLILVSGLFFLALVYVRSLAEGKEFLVSLFVMGWFLRIGATLILHWYSLSKGHGGFFTIPDDRMYHSFARGLSGQWLGGHHPGIGGPHIGYPLFLGVLYLLVGPVLITGKSLVGAIVPVYIYGIGRDLFDPKVGRWSALMAVGYPDFLFWSGWLLKDMFIAFLASFVVYEVIRVCRFSELKKAVPLALSLFYLALLRGYAGFIFSVAILLYFLVAGSRWIKGFSLAMLCVCAVVLLGFILNLSMPSGLNPTIAAYRGIFRLGGGWAPSSGVPATLLGKLWLFNKAFWWMLVNPTWISPPQGYSPYRCLLYPGAAIWYGLIPLSMYGMYYALKERIKESVLMLLPIFSLMLVYALVFGGGGARQRLQVMPFLLIFAGVGLVKAVEWFRQRFQRGVYVL